MLSFLKRERVPMLLLIGALLLTMKALNTEKHQKTAPTAQATEQDPFYYLKNKYEPDPIKNPRGYGSWYLPQTPDQERFSTRSDFK